MTHEMSCLLIKTDGSACGEEADPSLGRCKKHADHVACQQLLLGKHYCGVAMQQRWDKIDPATNRRHPHHRHADVRMVVVPPEYRKCQVCKVVVSTLNGFCEKHDSFKNQIKRENVLQYLQELTRGDREEMIKVLRETDEMGKLVLKLKDITEFQPISNPYEELYRLAGQVIKWKDILAMKVSQLHEVGYETRHSGEQIKAEVQLFTQALNEARQILVAISKLDVEERMVRIAEAQALMIAETLSRVLDSLGLDDYTVMRARAGVADRLRVIGQQRAIES